MTEGTTLGEAALAPHPVSRLAVQIAPRVPFLLVFAFIILGIALFLPDRRMGLGLLFSGIVLLWLAALLKILAARQKRAVRSLHDSIAAFVALDASPSFTTDLDGVIGYQNAAAIERFGGRGGETLLAAMSDVFASPSSTLFRLQNKAMAKGAAREDVALRRGHLRLSVHQIGQNGFLWRLEDIMDRSHARGGETISLPMMTVTRAGTVTYMNDALRRLVGGREANLDRIITDLPLRTGDVHAISGANGKLRALVAEVEGPDNRREIYLLPEGKARAAEWELLDALPVPLLKISPAGDVMLANRPARELLADHHVAGQPLANLVEGLGRSVQDWVAEAAAGRTVMKAEVVRATKPRHEVYLQVTLNRVFEGEHVSLIAVLNDATELKSLEAQFVQSQKMQAIGQLAGGVAHDFNNLLTAMTGHCDLLLLRHGEDSGDYNDLKQIQANGHRAAALVSQLLAFSRKQTLKPEYVDMRDVFSELSHLLARLLGEKFSLDVKRPEKLRMVRADPRQLEQVFINLCVNARDAMTDGGVITIEPNDVTLTEHLERDRVKIPPGHYVTIQVKDSGIGIPPDKVTKVFEPFFTTKRTGEGTGLGLSTAYGIVKQTGGFIFVDSTVNVGTCFTVYLPAHEKTTQFEAKPDAAPAPVVIPSAQGSGVILLVEDEAPVRAFASRALKMRGYTVIECDCAEKALETLEDDGLNIDLFVTDVIMPGMDGPTWVAKAQEKRPDVKVVFVSGYAEDRFSDQQSRIRNSVFLPKPFSLSDLTATVHAQLNT